MTGEYSRRLLLIRHLVTVTAQRPELFRPGDSPAAGWDLLAATQARSARTVLDLICHPTTGLWAAHTTRRLAAVAGDDAPLWTHLAHLSAIAGAAAVLTGLEADLRIPVRRGIALLPLLGHARLPVEQPWTLADLHVEPGRAWVIPDGDPGNAVQLQVHGDGTTTGTQGWTPAPTIRCTAEGRTLTVGLEVTDPYPGLFGLPPSSRPADRDLGHWSDLLDAAWTVLVRDHPGQADGLASGLRLIVPLADDPTVPVSGSAADAFGAAAVRSAAPIDLAAALVHEFQHSVLNGLLHLVPLIRDDDQLYYAPWRDDPRPLTSLLHGAYAFSAVTRFWRTRCRNSRDAQARAAEFEFALWRARTDRVLTTLVEAGALTGLGQRLVDRIRSEVQGWLDEPVPEPMAEAAGLAVRAHYAAWRAQHLRPDPDWVAWAALTWRLAPTEPAPEPGAAPSMHADPGVEFLDLIARRFRAEFTGTAPEHGERPTAEVALVSGETERARQIYLDEIQQADRPTAWGGLAATVTAEDALLTRPESVRALYRALRHEAPPPSVLDLAHWLSRPARGRSRQQ